ncbi:DNA-binding transcriptional regulator [Shinella sp. DD12]|uniref:helix-turn-helix domain-containing protein n=1 Tax=Shinella sp. DD12 TaxID=1410620 RepID=UPI0004379A43|nr:helix-turn-helix domain-containing protein [Shinella sp. DD12]EYR81856.1 hypothetical protein SHLA_4c001480 [Shinella sp. DD12]
MTSEEFKAIRKRLGYKQEALAALLGYGSKVRISEFESGTRDVPRLLALLMAAMDQTGWRPAPEPVESRKEDPRPEGSPPE